MARLNPYLHFDGNTEEVFNFYRSVFGGEFAMVKRFGEVPGCDDMPEGSKISASDKEKIMHIALPLGDENVLMGTDRLESMRHEMIKGNDFSLSLSADSREEADRIFAGLADGGKVEMPLADAFWGAYFGMLEDKFGVSWMVSYDEKYS